VLRALTLPADWLFSRIDESSHIPQNPREEGVISNVPGPPVPLYAAGARVEAAYPHGPVLEGAGMNITVMRYQDSVDFGVIACRESVPDVGDIALGFGAAVADLLKRALEESPRSTAERIAA
jgi:hypothetical protein